MMCARVVCGKYLLESGEPTTDRLIIKGGLIIYGGDGRREEGVLDDWIFYACFEGCGNK